MKTTWILALSAILNAQEYTLGPDSQRQAGVPQGQVTKYTWTSKLYPGTVRDYWVYVPSQYDGSKPVCVMIFQDGANFAPETAAFRAPIVLDNLIHKKEMPVTIGIFVSPGVMPAADAERQPRFNRSFEYDALGDRYARFLLEEILPEVGKQYKLSTDPNDRGIGGSSSGASAAFTAAWNRPDAFRRVLSFIGSYTNLRGAHIYSSLVRKTEPKPLRVYLQDGRSDQSIYAGDWFVANQDMASALKFAGYDTTFVIGTEGHNSRHGSSILPDALRWLWRDHPKPIGVAPAISERHEVRLILDSSHKWELAGEGYKSADSPTVDAQGALYFADPPNNRIHKISPAGAISVFKEGTGGATQLMVGADTRIYAVQPAHKRLVAYDVGGTERTIVDGVIPGDLAITRDGSVYFTEPASNRISLVDAKGGRRALAHTLTSPANIGLSADQSLLYVSEAGRNVVWSFQIQKDGSISNGQPFYVLERLDNDDDHTPGGLIADTDGYMYATTKLGIQVCDQAGRVTSILNPPSTARITNLAFGGSNLQILYITAGDKVYRRTIRRKGVVAWSPVKPPAPRL